MDQRTREILVITQEEAAEVIQEISKIFRFGIDTPHRDGMSHREKLQTEIGDLVCMIHLLCQHGVVDTDAIEKSAQDKVEKLRIYSDIYR